MNCIIGVDPGETTGLVHIQSDISKYKLISICSYEMNEAIFLITNLKPNLVIFESSPVRGSKPQFERVVSLVRLCDELTIPYFTVHAGQWKPLAKANKWKHPKASNSHEKDAYNLTRWVLLKQFGIDIGIL